MAEATQEHQPVKGPRIKKGLVVVNTGNGKGKTTAALGVLFRAWGRDMNVRMFQFLKHTGSQFGESRAAKKLGIDMVAMGDGFTWRTKNMSETQDLGRAAVHADGSEEPCGDVSHRGSHSGRWAAGRSRQAHDAAHGLDD